MLNLSRAIQLCVDLATHLLAGASQPPPETMGQAFEQLASARGLDADLALRLRKAVGFRNLAVHSYARIDWKIVHTIASKHLEDFGRFGAWVETASQS